MVVDGRDGQIERFTTLSDLTGAGGIAVTYLTSARFAGLLRSGDDVAVVTRADLRGYLQTGNIALIVEGDPHDQFYTAFAAAVGNEKYERLPHAGPEHRQTKPGYARRKPLYDSRVLTTGHTKSRQCAASSHEP